MWKTIQDFPDYEVSRLGEIRRKKSQRVLKPSKMPNGYCRVNLRKDKANHTKYVHRLVAEAFLDNPLHLGEVNHIDRDKTNNTVENLEWINHQKNVQHRYDTEESQGPRVRVVFLNQQEVTFNSIKECAVAFSVDPTSIRDYAQYGLTPQRKIQANFYLLYEKE